MAPTELKVGVFESYSRPASAETSVRPTFSTQNITVYRFDVDVIPNMWNTQHSEKIKNAFGSDLEASGYKHNPKHMFWNVIKSKRY